MPHNLQPFIVGERPLHGSSEEVCDLVESFGILYHYSSDRHYQRQWTTTNWSGCKQFFRRWWWRLRFYTQKHWRTCTLCDDKPVCQALPALPRELLPMNFGYPWVDDGEEMVRDVTASVDATGVSSELPAAKTELSYWASSFFMKLCWWITHMTIRDKSLLENFCIHAPDEVRRLLTTVREMCLCIYSYWGH